MSRLLLVRHGKTSARAYRYCGHSQVGLSSEGVEQAQALRRRLAGETINEIYSSDLSRARLTAEIIASAHPVNVALCPELRELDFGEIEGMTFEEVERLCPRAVALWSGQDLDACAPGGESLRQLASRVQGFMARLSSHSPGETVLIVAHAGPLRVLVCKLLGIELQRQWQIRLDLASLSGVECCPQGAIVSFLNETSHLKALMEGHDEVYQDSSLNGPGIRFLEWRQG